MTEHGDPSGQTSTGLTRERLDLLVPRAKEAASDQQALVRHTNHVSTWWRRELYPWAESVVGHQIADFWFQPSVGTGPAGPGT